MSRQRGVLMKSFSQSLGKLWNTAWRALASTRLAIWLLASLGLLTLSGTLLPQLPAAINEASRAMWFALAEQKYGSLYAFLRSLRLFELYRSPAFLALLAALFVNTALCTVNRLRALSRMMRRQRLEALGTLITHIAVIAFMLSLAVSKGYAWQESAVALAMGQTHPLGHGKALLLRSDGFRIEKDAQGQPTDYIAQITVLAGDRETRTSSIKLNAPLRVAGVSVWLVSYEPGVRVQVRDQEGQPLILESDAGEGGSGQVTLNLSSGLALLHVPSAGLELHISKATESEAGQAFYLQVLRSGTANPLLAEKVSAGQEIRVADICVTLYSDPYVIYRLKSDPGALPTLLSALALVAGTALSLFSESEHEQ